MGLWSRLKQLRRTVLESRLTDHPWGFPSQQELENGPTYTPGGLNLSQYYPKSDDRETGG